MLLNIILLIGTFFIMEFVAWFTHKYIMHGYLWSLHKDHHQKEPGFFEKNDSFFLIFAIPSMILIFLGFSSFNYMFWIGSGILLYGIAYFLVHDVFIHQRFKLFRRTNNIYLKAIRRAHRTHHKYLNKEDGECFGMLIVPWKYLKQAKSSGK